LKPENKAQLQAILKYHVLPVEVFSKDLTEGLTAATVDGPSVTVTSVTPPTINDASEIINPLDVAASNGVVHTIDAVLTPPTLYAYLGTLGDYSTLLAAIDAADLKDTLNGAGTFTLFAPTDAAFAALPDGTVEDLLKPENKDQLVAILTYHVLGTEVTSADLTLNLKATTVNGAEIEITSLDPPTINDASEIVPPLDVGASNGYLHTIDAVLIPPSDTTPEPSTASATPQPSTQPAPGSDSIYEIAKATPDFSTLTAAIEAADLVETLSGPGTFTVFAPNNAAFAALPDGTVEDLLKPENKAQLQAILKYHVLPVEVFSKDLTEGLTAATVDGPSVTVTSVTPPTINDASEIINPLDVAASNGVVHTIDAVLTPPTLYAYLGTLGDYSTLLAAIDAADLKDTLNGAGTFTLFAPTDAAFAALPDGTVEDLLKPENKDQLVAILTYHVLGTEVTSADLTLNLKATTVNGAEIEITSLDPPTINDASEIVPPLDVGASNGYLHTIDAVLIPPSDTTPQPTPAGGSTQPTAMPHGGSMQPAAQPTVPGGPCMTDADAEASVATLEACAARECPDTDFNLKLKDAPNQKGCASATCDDVLDCTRAGWRS